MKITNITVIQNESCQGTFIVATGDVNGKSYTVEALKAVLDKMPDQAAKIEFMIGELVKQIKAEPVPIDVGFTELELP